MRKHRVGSGRGWRRGAVVVVVGALLAVAGAAPAAAAPGDAFQPVPCTELGVTAGPALAGLAQLECGRLPVPENRVVPGSRTIQLAVVIARSTAAEHRPDPLFFAQGGPGGPTIDTYLNLLPQVLIGPLASGRDVVLFDQRGTGRSTPALVCPELTDLAVDTAEQDLSTDEAILSSDVATAACQARLVADGVDLAGYTTVQNAADVEALRRALGYEKINFYGVSYGTALGLEVLRSYSPSLRSIVLDGVVPPQINFIETAGTSLDGAMTALFDDCAAQPRCAEAFPDLEATFAAQVERLDRMPARVAMTDAATGITYQVPLRGDDLQSLLFQLLYAAPLLPALPQLIHDVRDDRFDTLGRIAGQILFDRSIASGMYLSVQCSEDLSPAAGTDAGLRPAVARFSADGVRGFASSCAQWPVPSLSPGIDAPVTSEVPALLLSGRFDPITPANKAALAEQTLPRSYSFTFPNTGHGAFTGEPCAAQIVRKFLDDPATRPADGCLTALAAPRFLTPDDVLRLPALVRLGNLEGRSGAELAVFGGALLVLLSAWLLLPAAWLIRRLQRVRRPGPPVRLARSAPWLVVLDGTVLVGFVIALVAVFVQAIDADQAALLFGLPADAGWILGLPVLAIVLGVLIAVGVVIGWRRGGWRLWRRLYLSLLALAALSCAVLLGSWGVG